ncbi:alpha/beta fold hydrolase [Vibrio quintilis]|uniref:AB hydrolase superfamily protein YdjP n=1 Tax=Vibrio quintilis TaxID=1117707 RepID=A0A1M7YU13_9VIBR|nr:alpha/beta hydrolase [Vibrio quintilis]SHO56082.1 AB hydrolase superfamily protein YdjP [Vibrio quintilis]
MKTTGYILLDGGKIYYELSGNKDGRPLLLMHGGLGRSEEMNAMVQHLSSTFRLIRVDFRGHGRSTPGDVPLTYAQYQKDVEAVLAYLDIEQFAIFGFSDGGIVAYRLAAAHPERVERLMTLGAQWRLEKDDVSVALLQSLTAEMWMARYPNDVERYKALNPEPDFERLVSLVKVLWLDSSATGYPGRSVEDIRCPTLILRGEDDFLFALSEAELLKTKIADCHFVSIPLTAHASHQESPELVGAMVNDFLLSDKIETTF